jgi:hypothetical protein
MWEHCLGLRNIELVVAYISWLVPGGPYLTSVLKADPAKTTGNHLFRTSRYLWPFIPQGQL